MDRQALLERTRALPRTARVAFAVHAARRVQLLFDGWMKEAIHASAVEAALDYAEKSAAAGVAGGPLKLPDQIAMMASAAAEAARSTYDDDLVPDTRPGGYVHAAYAAYHAARAAARAVLAVGVGSIVSNADVEQALLEAIEARREKGEGEGYFRTNAEHEAAAGRGEAAFLQELVPTLARLEAAAAERGWSDGSPIPAELFCAPKVRYRSAFISYSHADAAFARRLYDALRGRGVECWLDEHDLKPGDRISDVIEQAISRSDRLLLCCSRASLGSWWVKDEIRKAQERERRGGGDIVVPLLLDRYLLDGWSDGLASDLRSRLACDFTGWEADAAGFQAGVERILAALRT